MLAGDNSESLIKDSGETQALGKGDAKGVTLGDKSSMSSTIADARDEEKEAEEAPVGAIDVGSVEYCSTNESAASNARTASSSSRKAISRMEVGLVIDR